jgi:hypothetical protein
MTRWPESDEQPGDEEREPLEGTWELDPNDPSHPDHDLSISAGYGDWEPAPKPLLTRRGVVLLLSVLIILGLFIPICARIT